MAAATASAAPEQALAGGRILSLPRLFLGLVILIEVALGALYAVKTPRWEAPDEPAHFNYVRSVVETGGLPVLRVGDYDPVYLERIKAAKFPADMPIDSIRYEMYQPPLYYLAAAPIYLGARVAGVDTLLSLRLLSVLFGALVLWAGYRVFVRVMPGPGFLPLAAVGLMAVIPMNVAMSAAVNADPLAGLLAAVLLLLCIRRAQGEQSGRSFIVWGGLLYGLALLTSTKIYPAGALLVLAEIGNRRRRAEDGGRDERRRTEDRGRKAGLWGPALRVLAVLFVLALVISGWWFVRNAFVYGGLDLFGWGMHDRVVTGQPTTAEWIQRYGLSHILADFFIITFKSFWAQFGWMGVLVNDRIYVGLFGLTAAALFGALLWAVRLARTRGAEGRGRGWSWALLATWLFIVLLAHAWYNLRYVQPQGRYLFPALIPIAAILVLGLNELLDKRYVRVTFALLYLALVALDVILLYWFILPQLRSG